MWRRLCVVLACTADAVHGGTGHKGQADVIEREKATNEAMKMLNMASNSVNQLVLVKVEETEMTDGKYHITLVTGISSCTKSDEILSIVQCPLEVSSRLLSRVLSFWPIVAATCLVLIVFFVVGTEQCRGADVGAGAEAGKW